MDGLPPGQRAVQGFPRFGVDLSRPPPTVSADSEVEVVGHLARDVSLAPATLAGLTRFDVVADLHCVAGWSAVGLTWSGSCFRDVYDRFIAPAVDSGRRPHPPRVRRRGRLPLDRHRR